MTSTPLVRKRKCFTIFKTKWDIHKWQEYCSESTYRILKLHELPDWFPQGLTSKFNAAVVTSSGNAETYVVVVMGYRVDGSFIDEHPYVAAFDKVTGKSFSGIIHHGDYPGRSTRIPQRMLQLLTSSGITTAIRFKRLPKRPSGSIKHLKKQGILTGFEHAVNTIEKKRRSVIPKLRIRKTKQP